MRGQTLNITHQPSNTFPTNPHPTTNGHKNGRIEIDERGTGRIEGTEENETQTNTFNLDRFEKGD
jgi:hypothetical protein